jgi:hypothetical protein
MLNGLPRGRSSSRLLIPAWADRVHPSFWRPTAGGTLALAEKIYCRNAWRHLAQHRLHLARIGALQAEIREQHNHVVSFATSTARRRCGLLLSHRLDNTGTPPLLRRVNRRTSQATGACLATAPPRPRNHCAFGFAGGGALVLAPPFFFFVFVFGAVSAGAA